jgi:hypothetical protein
MTNTGVSFVSQFRAFAILCASGLVLMTATSCHTPPNQPPTVSTPSDRAATDLRAELDRRTKNQPEQPNSRLSQESTPDIINPLIYKQKTLYPDTDWQDSYEISDPQALEQANSVVAFVDREFLEEAGRDYKLSTITLGKMCMLCGRESFVSQPVGAFCSGFVVSANTIATAAHCLSPSVTHVPVDSIRLIFGFRMTDAATSVTLFPKPQVFSVSEVLAINPSPEVDYALVKVDREITDHVPLKMRESGTLTDKDKVYALGHPSGIPLKYAGNAEVTRVDPSGLFTAKLDTFAGNSGSPVMNQQTHLVEGILIRGGTDYVLRGKCNIALVCPNTGCDGELCIRIAPLLSKMTQSATTPSIKVGGVPKSALSVDRAPYNDIKSSDPKESGLGSSFSPWYELPANPPRSGYKIGDVSFSLTGDRTCGAWSECVLDRKNDTQVTLRFREPRLAPLTSWSRMFRVNRPPNTARPFGLFGDEITLDYLDPPFVRSNTWEGRGLVPALG